jgi:hypothetical protein
MLTREKAQQIAERHAAEGRQIEAAWTLVGLRDRPETVPDKQVEAMRNAFYLGADFIVQMLITAEDSGWSPDDLAGQLVELTKELDAFILGRTLQAARDINGETSH